MAGRPAKEAPTASALPPALLRLLASRGVEAGEVAAPFGLTCNASELDEVPITPARLGGMLRAATELLADPHLALALPLILPFRRYDALALAARASGSPRAVFELVVKYAPLVFPSLEAELEAADDELRIHLRVAGHPRGLGLAVDEYVLATTLGHATRGGEVRAKRVWLQAARPTTLDPLFRAFGTEEIELGARTTGFAIPTAAGDAVLPGGDPMLLATASHLASAALAAAPRRGAFAVVVTTKIESMLGGASPPSCEAIAEALHMSERTLQRRLEEEDTRFSEVLEACRSRVARELLVDESLSLGEIAYRVGFSDLATFSRAFKRWSGMPPGAYRRRGR